MNKLATSIVFSACFLISACTVHHYHHEAPRGKKGKCDAKECSRGHDKAGREGLPEGHPPVKGCGMKGHGKKGHHGLPEGHPPVEGHGMKGHGMKGHGMKGHGMKGHGGEHTGHPHGGNDRGKDPFRAHGEGDAEHEKLHANLPAAVSAFHESFAPVWHEENDATRSTAACAKSREWDKLAKGVVAHKAQGEKAVAYAAASKTLVAKLKVVTASCRKKDASVQEELTAAHEALHEVLKALAK